MQDLDLPSGGHRGGAPDHFSNSRRTTRLPSERALEHDDVRVVLLDEPDHVLHHLAQPFCLGISPAPVDHARRPLEDGEGNPPSARGDREDALVVPCT